MSASTSSTGPSSAAEAPDPSMGWPHTGTPSTETLEPAPVRPRKVAIVGYTPTRDLALELGAGWELWGMNDLHKYLPAERFSRWYDLHPSKAIASDTAHAAWLGAGSAGLTTFVWEPRPEWPRTVAYPRAEIVDAFGTYFTNSVSWMIAHAIGEGDVGTIGVYGIDMAQTTEYAGQRPSCEYFIGLARGLGIEVVIPDASDLLRGGGLYGTDDDPSGLRAKIEARLAELRDLQAQASAGREHNDRLWHQCQGAIENLAYFHDVWTMPAVARAPESE